MRVSDFDYDLPPELIAQHPAIERTSSRLLHLDGETGAIEDLQFRDILSHVRPGDVLVVNDTRVIKARLRGRKDSGGEVEVLVERVLDAHRALAQVRASKTPKVGRRFVFAEGVEAQVLGRRGEFFELYFGPSPRPSPQGGKESNAPSSRPSRLSIPAPEGTPGEKEKFSLSLQGEGWGEGGVLDILAKHGEVPLPPYITHAAVAEDESRYQTVYARTPGAVAAPTAGLHFDEELLASLEAQGVVRASVTLHVGAGTFQPVRVEDISRHVMHSEWYSIPQETVDAIARARAAKGRVIAVGTTALRALESAAVGGSLRAGIAETRLFIVPGYRFQVVDRLITNFHLPRSTLLMLVSAFAGSGNIRSAYRHAISHGYRFFSYGDAMLLGRMVSDTKP